MGVLIDDESSLKSRIRQIQKLPSCPNRCLHSTSLNTSTTHRRRFNYPPSPTQLPTVADRVRSIRLPFSWVQSGQTWKSIRPIWSSITVSSRCDSHRKASLKRLRTRFVIGTLLICCQFPSASEAWERAFGQSPSNRWQADEMFPPRNAKPLRLYLSTNLRRNTQSRSVTITRRVRCWVPSNSQPPTRETVYRRTTSNAFR